jgi:hypothetical protein
MVTDRKKQARAINENFAELLKVLDKMRALLCIIRGETMAGHRHYERVDSKNV